MNNEELNLLNDVYDYLFENDADIGTNFLREFRFSYLDNTNGYIMLESPDLGKFKITLRRYKDE